MDNSEIICVLKDFYLASGVNISLYDKDLKKIAEYPDSESLVCSAIRKNGASKICSECIRYASLSAEYQKKSVYHKAGCGLNIAVSPIYDFGALSGFIVIGPTIEEMSDEKAVSAGLLRILGKPCDAKEALGSLITLSRNKLEVYSRLMALCIRSLTPSEEKSAERLTVAEATKKYVIENYEAKIRISDMCNKLGCSKSTLISSFKREYGITIGDFITDYRLSRAKKLLENEDFSINEIANKTGFYDQAYFSRVFSAKCEKSPSEYRRVAKYGEGDLK